MFEIYQHRRVLKAAAVTAALLLVGACASAPSAPTASLNQAKKAIETAERMNAGQYANAELDEARQKLVSANKAVVAENMVLADRYAEQSTVTAELATARTEAAKAQDVNAEIQRGVNALVEEMQRTGDTQ